jgi:hypothetical protein
VSALVYFADRSIDHRDQLGVRKNSLGNDSCFPADSALVDLFLSALASVDQA